MKSVVLLSGGLDSTILLADRVTSGDQVVAISFDYGQVHRAKELKAAKAVAEHYGVRHRLVGAASTMLPSALTGSMEIPESHADRPDATTVPGRNLILLSIGVAIAEAEGAQTVLIGANKDDHAGYLDCRPLFIEAVSRAAQLGTASGVGVRAPFIDMSKEEIVRFGRSIGAPIELSWSCYRGGDQPCNRCGACESRNEAMT